MPIWLARRALLCSVCCLSAASVACSGTEAEIDAGAPAADATVTDRGFAPDAEPVDLGTADAGPEDASAPDAASMDATAPDATPDPVDSIVPLFDETTTLEPAIVEDTPTALISRFSDRGRDRHAREDQFQAYEHYLPFYWEHRTVQIEIVDPIGRGGDTITFNVTTEWRLHPLQAELRFFYRGIGTVAEYFDNGIMSLVDQHEYTRSVSFNSKEGRALQVGDRMEFELSQFLDAPPRGRSNYYGTTFLYVVGEGIQPWAGTGPRRDSEPLPAIALSGGATTIHANESNEPEYAFSQMATNTAPANAQPFMLGRRLAHTDFADGGHDESPDNPTWVEQAGKAGPAYILASCNGCHFRNGRAVPPSPGEPLTQYVVKVGDASGQPHPDLGGVLQPAGGTPERGVSIRAWLDADGKRTPDYAFETAAPEQFSARISPALVGLGLLEAIPEAAILANHDPDDLDGDGISGRAHIVTDAVTGDARLGRFGYKAGQPTLRQQTAGALRTDMGVLTSVYPTPDCGSAQTGCGPEGAELSDEDLDQLTLYVALLGVPPRRNLGDPQVMRGAELFEEAGCDDCHSASFTTSSFAPHAELRGQTIRPYTDLLLHDMGPELADDLDEGGASGAEWRTPPLWGLGRTEGVSGGQAYLHDGRARTLTEAIRWHGGEGADARDAFEAMPLPDRTALIRFLESL